MDLADGRGGERDRGPVRKYLARRFSELLQKDAGSERSRHGAARMDQRRELPARLFTEREVHVAQGLPELHGQPFEVTERRGKVLRDRPPRSTGNLALRLTCYELEEPCAE